MIWLYLNMTVRYSREMRTQVIQCRRHAEHSQGNEERASAEMAAPISQMQRAL